MQRDRQDIQITNCQVKCPRELIWSRRDCHGIEISLFVPFLAEIASIKEALLEGKINGCWNRKNWRYMPHRDQAIRVERRLAMKIFDISSNSALNEVRIWNFRPQRNTTSIGSSPADLCKADRSGFSEVGQQRNI